MFLIIKRVPLYPWKSAAYVSTIVGYMQKNARVKWGKTVVHLDSVGTFM